MRMHLGMSNLGTVSVPFIRIHHYQLFISSYAGQNDPYSDCHIFIPAEWKGGISIIFANRLLLICLNRFTQAGVRDINRCPNGYASRFSCRYSEEVAKEVLTIETLMMGTQSHIPRMHYLGRHHYERKSNALSQTRWPEQVR